MRFERVETTHGTPLYVYHMPHARRVATGILVFVGGRDEDDPADAGLTHACEHMVFEGNARLGTSLEISEEIETFGGSTNANTSQERTFFYQIAPFSEFHVSVKSLASMLTLSLFRPENIGTEMERICQEIRERNDNHGTFCGKLLRRAVFGNHPNARDVIGSEETVRAFARDDFLRWQKRFYHPGNYAFIVVGNISASEAERVFNNEYFGENAGPINIHPVVQEITGSRLRTSAERDVKQAHTFLGIAIGGTKDSDTQLLDFFASMVGGGMSFPLFQEVSGKRGLCYSVSAGVGESVDRSTFAVSVSTDPGKIHGATACIIEVLMRSRNDAVLFKKAQRSVLGHNALAFEKLSSVFSSAVSDLVFLGTPRSPDEISREIASFTLDEITVAVERHLVPEKFSYAHIVPKGTVL